MSIATRIKRAFGLEKRELNPNDVWGAFHQLRHAITPESAGGIAAVYGAVSLISEALGSLPLKLYRQGRQVADGHPLHTALHEQPNDAQSPQEFIEYLSASMLLHGNAYARIRRGHDGQVRELMPLAPERVTVLRRGDGIAGYEYTDRDGIRTALLPADIFHLRHRAGADPLMGQSPIQAARQVVELAAAEAEHGINTFRNGTRATGILSLPGKLKSEQRQSLRDSWQSQYAGGKNAGRTVVLEEGATFTPVSMSLEDAEWIAARQFTVQEVARIFKVPPPLLADLGNANFSNVQALNRLFVAHCLGRHMRAWEGAISRQLLTETGRQTYHPEFSAEGLLRGDSVNRATFYTQGIAAGWLLPSEARALENMPAVPGIDERPRQSVGQPGNYPSTE